MKRNELQLQFLLLATDFAYFEYTIIAIHSSANYNQLLVLAVQGNALILANFLAFYLARWQQYTHQEDCRIIELLYIIHNIKE